jgi:hypothetical protein
MGMRQSLHAGVHLLPRLYRMLLYAMALLFASPAGATTTSTFFYQLDGAAAKAINPPTRANVQAVLDLATPARKLSIQQGPGNLDVDSTLWIHGNTSWSGQGKGISTITRTRFNVADPPYHGDVMNSARWAMHTPNLGLTGNVPTDSLANITITSITIDGNCSAWPSADPNHCNNFGIQIWFSENVTIRGIEIKNTLQTAIEFDACRGVHLTDFYIHDVGKQLNIGTRNGVNLNNNSNNLVASSRWARDMTVSGGRIDNHRDTMLDCANVSDVTISDIRSHCDYDSVGNQPGQAGNDVFEFEGSIAGYTMRNFDITNITARGQRNVFFIKSGTAPPLDGLEMSDVDFWASDSSKGVCIAVGGSAGGARNVRISKGTFRNLNRKGSGAFLYCYSRADTIRNVTFENLTFESPIANVYNAQNRGAQIGGNACNVKLLGCTFRNAGAEGVAIFANKADVAREILVQDCSVDGAQREGFIVQQAGVNGKVNGVRFVRNIAKDTNRNTSGYAFRALASTGDIRAVWFLHNKIVRTSGTNMNGLQLNQSGRAVLDSVWVAGNELTGAAKTSYGTSGTVTHVFLRDPPASPATSKTAP